MKVHKPDLNLLNKNGLSGLDILRRRLKGDNPYENMKSLRLFYAHLQPEFPSEEVASNNFNSMLNISIESVGLDPRSLEESKRTKKVNKNKRRKRGKTFHHSKSLKKSTSKSKSSNSARK